MSEDPVLMETVRNAPVAPNQRCPSGKRMISEPERGTRTENESYERSAHAQENDMAKCSTLRFAAAGGKRPARQENKLALSKTEYAIISTLRNKGGLFDLVKEWNIANPDFRINFYSMIMLGMANWVATNELPFVNYMNGMEKSETELLANTPAKRKKNDGHNGKIMFGKILAEMGKIASKCQEGCLPNFSLYEEEDEQDAQEEEDEEEEMEEDGLSPSKRARTSRSAETTPATTPRGPDGRRRRSALRSGSASK